MPQRGRGGKRTGKPGATYGNRTDMQQAPRAVPGQTYGKATQQLEAQRAMPLPAAPPPAVGGAPARPGPAPRPMPTPLDAPTERPAEPLTAGLATGPGPGPEVIGATTTQDDRVLAQLRGLYAAYPNSDLAALIDAAERRNV